MKNVLSGGLRSLIPNRQIKDADEVLDELDDGIEQEEEVTSKSKKVAILSEDEGSQESIIKEEKVVVKPVKIKKKKVTKEAVMPSKPQVTPLQIDVDGGEDLDVAKPEKKTKTQSRKASAVSAKQVSIKSAVKITAEPAVEKVIEKTEEKVSETPVAQSDNKVGKMKVSKKKLKETDEGWDKHETDVQHIKLKDIRVNPNQPRREFNQVDMEDLKNSIDLHGILQPLVVRRTGSGIELVAGERRMRAASELGWEKVPCVVRVGVTSGASILELALIENIQREDLNSVEEALAYKQLNEEYGMTHEEIGERVGRSRVSVTNIIRVLQLPEEIQKGLVDEKISAGHAKAILMIPDEEKQLRFYRHLVEEGLTVRKAETRARRIQRTMRLDDPMRSKRRGRSTYEMKSSGNLEDRYGYNAKLRFDEHKNKYEVVFKCFSKEEIDQLFGRLMGTEDLPVNSQDQDVIDTD